MTDKCVNNSSEWHKFQFPIIGMRENLYFRQSFQFLIDSVRKPWKAIKKRTMNLVARNWQRHFKVEMYLSIIPFTQKFQLPTSKHLTKSETSFIASYYWRSIHKDDHTNGKINLEYRRNSHHVFFLEFTLTQFAHIPDKWRGNSLR